MMFMNAQYYTKKYGEKEFEFNFKPLISSIKI